MSCHSPRGSDDPSEADEHSQGSKGPYRGIYNATSSSPTSKSIGKPQSSRSRIAVACSRCRRRKIRCTGETIPGEGCDNCKACEKAEDCRFLRVNSDERQVMATSPNTMPPPYRFAADHLLHRRGSPYSPEHHPTDIAGHFHGLPQGLGYYSTGPSCNLQRQNFPLEPAFQHENEANTSYSAVSPDHMFPTQNETSTFQGPLLVPRVWYHQPNGQQMASQGFPYADEADSRLTGPMNTGFETNLPQFGPVSSSPSSMCIPVPLPPDTPSTERILPAPGPTKAFSQGTANLGSVLEPTAIPRFSNRPPGPWNPRSLLPSTNATSTYNSASSVHPAHSSKSILLSNIPASQAISPSSPSSEKVDSQAEYITKSFDTSPSSECHPRHGFPRSISRQSQRSDGSSTDCGYGYDAKLSIRRCSNTDQHLALLSDGQEYRRVPPLRSPVSSKSNHQEHLEDLHGHNPQRLEAGPLSLGHF